MPVDNAEPTIESLERIFQQITDAPKLRKESMLAELCPDPNVQGLVRGLLEADSSDGLPIDKELFASPIELSLGEHIGPYKLLQKIGEGGMGVVYMAEQTVPVRRKVALKIIKLGTDSKQVLARFAAERQALSMMEHPNIAKVLDAGATESGRPYFAMELVKGHSITQYVQEQKLSIREKLELLMTVCHAIQHAHQKGIIHRDLKPSNVLVAEYDGRPVAKVIDFGVAKAIESPLSEITMFTGFGQIVGTLEYMSPEQSRMNQLDVDVRSDVYSLGVLFYELITGSTPIARERLRTAAWDEILRVIREEDPPLPSTRLSDLAGENHGVSNDSAKAKSSQIELQKLSRLVRGELDWIVMKSLEKDRTRRYASPGDMAKDIQSFLNGDIVTACPPSMVYRLQKTVKRHKLAFLTSGLVAVALILGLAGTTWQAWRATKAERIANAERDLAKEQAEKAAEAERAAQLEAEKFRAFDEFLQVNLFGFKNGMPLRTPDHKTDPNVKLSELLDRARERLSNNNDKLESRTPNQLYLKLWLSRSYWNIGCFAQSTSLLEEFVDELKKTTGPQHEFTLQYVFELAQVYAQQYRWWDALALYEEAFVGRRRLFGEQHPETLRSLNNVANAFRLLGLYKRAAAKYQLLLEMEQRNNGNNNPLVDVYQAQLARVSFRLEQTADRYERMQGAIEIYRQQQDIEGLHETLSEHGLACLHLGNLKEAKRLLVEACDLSKSPGITDRERAKAQIAHAVVCLMVPQNDAQATPSVSIEASLASFLKEPVMPTAPALDDLRLLANCLQRIGKLEQAEQVLRRALQILGRHPLHGTRQSAILADLADISWQRNDHLETKHILLQAVDHLNNTEKYPTEYNQMSESEAKCNELFSALADRLVQVHQKLGDHEAADNWQKKIGTHFKTGEIVSVKHVDDMGAELQ